MKTQEKKYQIMNFSNGKQRTYNVEDEKWNNAEDRWSDTFCVTPKEARRIFRGVYANFRKTQFNSAPKLHQIR